jgi:hypothetical protein
MRDVDPVLFELSCCDHFWLSHRALCHWLCSVALSADSWLTCVVPLFFIVNDHRGSAGYGRQDATSYLPKTGTDAGGRGSVSDSGGLSSTTTTQGKSSVAGCTPASSSQVHDPSSLLKPVPVGGEPTTSSGSRIGTLASRLISRGHHLPPVGMSTIPEH